jgi:uncharacterized protein (DUF1330 family)
MAAYFIANISVNDREGYQEYADRAPDTIAEHGGKYIVRAGAHDVLEGDWQPDRLVVIEFPNREMAMKWYNSPDYQAILLLRQANSTGSVVIVDGTDG